MPGNQLVKASARRLHHGQQSHRFMIRPIAVDDGLPGQPEPEIAPRPRHDAETTHHIMIDLASAAVDFVVDSRKIVFHVDPLSHDLRRG